MQTRKTQPNLARWALIALIVVAAAIVYLLMYRPRSPEPTEKSRPNTEWTVAPDSSGVPVNLPKTPMRNVPAEKASPAPEASRAQ